jgi:hypothetical protein
MHAISSIASTHDVQKAIGSRQASHHASCQRVLSNESTLAGIVRLTHGDATRGAGRAPARDGALDHGSIDGILGQAQCPCFIFPSFYHPGAGS